MSRRAAGNGPHFVNTQSATVDPTNAMAIAFNQLQNLMKQEGYTFYVAPDEPTLRFWVRGTFGQYDVVALLQDEGRFLQFRVINYLSCPPHQANLTGLLQTLLTINAQKRMVKFGWDPATGEITAYADIWLMDNQLTQEQLSRMLAILLPVVDAARPRIQGALETGRDPGEQDDRGQPPGSPRPEEKPEIKEI